MPRPHSVRAGSRARGLPRVSALGMACLSGFAMHLANCSRRKGLSSLRALPGKPLPGEGQPVRSHRQVMVWGRGSSLPGMLFTGEQTHLFEHVIWGMITARLPSASQHLPKLLHKPLKSRGRKEKPPGPPVCAPSGVLVGTNGKIEKKSQSGDKFLLERPGEKRKLV